MNVTLNNITVINSTGMGVTMYDVTGNVNVQNSTFSNNRVPSNELEKYPGGGGFSVEFTFCEPGVVDEADCETSANNNSTYLFYNCIFQSNYATTVNESSTTYIAVAYGFSNQQFGRGGGLSVFFKGRTFNNSVTIDNCTFMGNHAIWGGGFHSDIVDHSENNTLNIINCVFNNNWCSSNDSAQNSGLVSYKTGGGAIRITLLFFNTRASVQYNSIKIQDCHFTRNSAYYGGAVSYKITRESHRIAASNALTFAGCYWLNNEAQTGSAVNLVSQPYPQGVTPHVIFSDCEFSNNINHYSDSNNINYYSDNSTKPVGIGSLYSDNIPVVLSGSCNFSHNEGTALAGSATYFILANNSVTRFDKNSGNNGGAIALLENTYLVVDPNTKLWFTDNKALSKGGAIYFTCSSERDFISSQKCFIFYSNRSAEQGNWNVSVNFQNNTDMFKKSIYATTLLPCVWENLPGNVEVKLSSVDVLFNQTFHFTNSSGSTVGSNSITDAISITVNERIPVQIPPGRLYEFNITSLDELGNEVKPVFFVQTLNATISVVDPTTAFAYNNKIRLYGRHNSSIKLQFESVNSRPLSLTVHVELSECPPGFYPNNTSNLRNSACICARDYYYGVYRCDNMNLKAYLYPYIWAGIIKKEDGLVFVTADCPKGYCSVSLSATPLPNALSLKASAKFEREECVNRNETLCGRCISGYCVAINSPTYECINATSSQFTKHEILWLILLKYIPFTIFLLLIIFFNVSLVDGPLNCYILFTQIIDSVGPVSTAITHLNDAEENKKTEMLSNLYYFLYGPWNANYFEMLMPEFCAYKFDSTITVLAFDYIPALYPLVFFILFYSIIPCITNCLINAEADAPRRCLLRVERMFIIFRRTWSVKNSIIYGLTTFLVLSYAKVTTVTGLLLSSTALGGHTKHDGEVKSVVRLDGAMDYLGADHWPYAGVAFVLLFTIILLPPLLLLSYPILPNVLHELNLQDKWLFKNLIIRPLDKCVPFFDAFQSCFKNKYRFFAGLYFLYRGMAVATLTFQWKMTARLIYLQGFFLITVLIHCVCQPYKLRRYNILDGCILVNLVAINSLSLYNVFYDEIYLTTSQVSFWVQLILIYAPFVYFMFFFFYFTYNRFSSCINKVKQTICGCLSKCGIRTVQPINDDDLPARLLDPDSSSDSSSSSSSAEDEDDRERERYLDMRRSVDYGNRPDTSAIPLQSSYQSGSQHSRRSRFTT